MKKYLIIGIIAFIIYLISYFFTIKTIIDLNLKINEIRFEQDYLDFVYQDNIKQ